MILCKHCKKEIAENSVQQGGLHMDCFHVEIDVWFISLPSAPHHGFCEASLDDVMSQLESIDHNEAYLIQKKEMIAGQYYNLPDFQGF